MKLLNKLFRKKSIIKNRKVTKARFLYLYIIFGSIAGLGYFIASLFLDYPKHLALTPLYLLVLFVVGRFLMKNWKLIWLYVRDMEQGKLLLFLNDNTHWSEEHKMKVINWVYLRRKTIRKETHAEISKKVMDGQELTKAEKKMFKFRSVYCPQQIKLSFNEALLIYALIWAHNNIQVLDDELRAIMDLTDEHILAFDLKKEYSKAGGNEYEKYMEIGKRVSENLNGEK